MNIYTDGAASNNGKENACGGWGYVLLTNEGETITAKGHQKGATNQQMELTAALEACRACEGYSSSYPAFNIHSDSAYLINCYLQKWWINWQKNGWRNAKKEPVANKELWEQLIPFFQNPRFNFIKVKGHSGDANNELADQLAVSARQEGLLS